jgi:hypothetical protein
LGVELIAARSPQARGRCERLFGTWQGRLPQELRLQGITALSEANKYLTERFIPSYNQQFTVKAAQAGSAFVTARGADLDKIFSHQETRTVKKDNTFSFGNRTLQIEAGDDRHIHIPRDETDSVVETIVTFLAPVGAPLRIDLPDPGNCPF